MSAAPQTIRCWRCNRTILVVETRGKGTVVVKKCERCRADNRIVVDDLRIGPTSS